MLNKSIYVEDGKYFVVQSNEFKVTETNRKEATQTEMPDKESPEGDAEKSRMEDWADTDKDGKPKRKDKVEYPSKLYEPIDKELSDEITYERKKDPLYLCNECFKTFRCNKPVCECGSENVEQIIKIKEDTSDIHLSKHLYSVMYAIDGEAKEERVMAFDEVDAKKYIETKKRGANVSDVKLIAEDKLSEQDEDNYSTVAKGIEDEAIAKEVARTKNGTVIPDSEDPNKFAVIMKKE